MAHRFRGWGFFPVVVYPSGYVKPDGKVSEGKDPIGKGWGKDQITAELIDQRFGRHPTAGVGLCLGPNKGPGGRWLIDVEGDGPQAEASMATLCDGPPPDTIGWGSARGSHRLFFGDDRLAGIVAQLGDRKEPGVIKNLPGLPDLELRIGGTDKQVQSVIPPTVGTDGMPRRWNDVRTIARLPDAAYVTLQRIAAEKGKGGKKQGPERPRTGNGKAARRGTVASDPGASDQVAAYFQKAIDEEVSNIEGAAAGERHITLRDASWGLAGFLWCEDFDWRAARAAMTAAARKVGLPDAEIDELLDGAEARTDERHPDGLSDALAEREKRRERERKRDERKEKEHDQPTDGRERPEIEVSVRRHEVIDQAVAVLPRDPTLYHRCERIVRVVEDTRTRIKVSKRIVIRQQEKSPRIISLATQVIGAALTRNADWYQWKRDSEGEFIAVDCHPPDWAIRAVETCAHWPGLRFLRSVAEAPFIRPDGSIVETPGYDADTETLYIPSGSYPTISSRPTQADARRAAQRLLSLVKQFPFLSDNHKVVWLAALLAVIGRPAITGACPGVVFDANLAGTGKGLLATIIGIITSGRDVATIGYPQDPAEMGKVVTSVALAGYPVVLLDNVPNGSKFGDSELDRALTSTVVDGRELGKSRMVGMLDITAVWFLTGNNIGPTADAFRRWLPCRLESPLQRPDRRKDLEIDDLPEHVREHRGELVAAALTILRAHAVAGWPVADWAPLGQYTAWDRVVRGAVWFATGLDCCKTQDELVQEDPERLEKVALANGWLELPGGDTGLTSADALEMIRDKPKLYDTLRNIFREWGSKGELATSRTIGNRLKAIKGQNVGGFKFIRSGKEESAVRWKVVRVGKESEESGESSPNPRAGNSDSDNYVNECSANGKTSRAAPEHTPQTPQTPPSAEAFYPETDEDFPIQ